jgi:hypothetical protein
VDYDAAMLEGWTALRSLVQKDQKASVLRYTITGRDPVTGTPGTKTLVANLADLDVVVMDVSESDLRINRGKLDMKDKSFVFYNVEISTIDQIKFGDDTFDIFGLRHVPGTGQMIAIGKRVGGTP